MQPPARPCHCLSPRQPPQHPDSSPPELHSCHDSRQSLKQLRYVPTLLHALPQLPFHPVPKTAYRVLPDLTSATLASMLFLRAFARATPFPEHSLDIHMAHSLTSSKSLLIIFTVMSTLSTLLSTETSTLYPGPSLTHLPQ